MLLKFHGHKLPYKIIFITFLDKYYLYIIKLDRHLFYLNQNF